MRQGWSPRPGSRNKRWATVPAGQRQPMRARVRPSPPTQAKEAGRRARDHHRSRRQPVDSHLLPSRACLVGKGMDPSAVHWRRSAGGRAGARRGYALATHANASSTPSLRTAPTFRFGSWLKLPTCMTSESFLFDMSPLFVAGSSQLLIPVASLPLLLSAWRLYLASYLASAITFVCRERFE